MSFLPSRVDYRILTRNRVSNHFTSLLSEVEGVWENFDVGGPLQFVSAIGGDVELDVVSLQQRHFRLGVLLSERQFLICETNPCTDPTGQRVVLQKQTGLANADTAPRLAGL